MDRPLVTVSLEAHCLDVILSSKGTLMFLYEDWWAFSVYNAYVQSKT